VNVEEDRVVSAWERFWFRAEPTSSLSVLRIVFGLLALAWTISLAPDLDAFFGRSGLLPKQPSAGGVWGVLGWFPSNLAVQILFAVLLCACIALTVGYQTRIAALLVFIGILSFERRNPYVFNTGDGLMRLLAFYLMLAPAGASMSVDSWHRGHGLWEFPRRSIWPIRLMQIQLSVIYLFGLWVKVQGLTWNNGTAVSYAMRITDLNRFPMPSFLIHSMLLANLMTYGTLALELSLGILVWSRRLRPWVLLAGVFLHLGIEYSIRVGFFSLAILTLYLSFLDPEWARRRLLAVRDALAHRRAAQVQPQRAAQPAAER
jgi:hypothetical protein